MDTNVINGPWPKPPQRRSLASLVALAGGASSGVVVDRKPVDPSLLAALGAKLECSAALAKSLSDEAKLVQRPDDAAILLHVASLLETRAANIELDLEVYE